MVVKQSSILAQPHPKRSAFGKGGSVGKATRRTSLSLSLSLFSLLYLSLSLWMRAYLRVQSILGRQPAPYVIYRTHSHFIDVTVPYSSLFSRQWDNTDEDHLSVLSACCQRVVCCQGVCGLGLSFYLAGLEYPFFRLASGSDHGTCSRQTTKVNRW